MKTILILLALVVCTQAGFSWNTYRNKLSENKTLDTHWKKAGSVLNGKGIWGQHKEWFKKMKKHLGQITEVGKKTVAEIWGNHFRLILEPTTSSPEQRQDATSEILSTTSTDKKQTTTEVQTMDEKDKPTIASNRKWSKMAQNMITKMKKKWAKKKWGKRKDKRFWTKTSGEEWRPSKMKGKPNRSKSVWAKNLFRKMWGKWGQKHSEHKG